MHTGHHLLHTHGVLVRISGVRGMAQAEEDEDDVGSVPAPRHLTTPAGFRSHYGGNDRRVSDTRGSGGGSPIHQP